MQDGLLRRVQIVDAFSNVESELFSVVPSHLDLHVVQQTPKRAPRAVLKHDAQVGLACARAQEENDIGVPNNFHHGAFVFEFLKLVLLDDFSLDLLDGDHCMLPTASVYDTIATFRELAIVA